MPKFDVNSTKILHTVINNIYTNKDIFIRELISNASDACEKLRYYNVSDEKYSKLENLDLKIEIEINKKNSTITGYKKLRCKKVAYDHETTL